MHRTKNIAVIGHGDGGHAELLHVLAEFFDVTGAIQQGIVGVQMQVDELGHESILVYRTGNGGKVWRAVRFEVGLVKKTELSRCRLPLPELFAEVCAWDISSATSKGFTR